MKHRGLSFRKFQAVLWPNRYLNFRTMTTQPTRTARAAGKTIVVTMTDKPPAYVPEAHGQSGHDGGVEKHRAEPSRRND